MSSTTPEVRPRVLSGIQPTADSYHLGNYLGAVRNWGILQADYEPFFFIADQHAITVEVDPKVLRRRTLVAAAHISELRLDNGRVVVQVGDRPLPVSRRHTREVRDLLVRRFRQEARGPR